MAEATRGAWGQVITTNVWCVCTDHVISHCVGITRLPPSVDSAFRPGRTRLLVVPADAPGSKILEVGRLIQFDECACGDDVILTYMCLHICLPYRVGNQQCQRQRRPPQEQQRGRIGVGILSISSSGLLLLVVLKPQAAPACAIR